MRVFVSAIILFSFLSIYPEPQPETGENFADEQNIHFKGYGSVTMRFSGLNENKGIVGKDSDFSLFLGAKGVLALNNFNIGASFSFVSNHVPHKCAYYQDYPPCYGNSIHDLISMTYGGLYFAYSLKLPGFVSLEPGLTIGGGSFKNLDDELWDRGYGSRSYRFFALEPEIQLVFNVSSFFATGFGASYRLIGGITRKGSNYGWKDLSGFAGVVDFRFGRF